MKKTHKILSLLLTVIVLAGMLAGCSGADDRIFQKMEDFEQAQVGVLTGSSFDLLATEYFPEADKLYYMNMTDLILNLKQDKIDGILMDRGFFTPIQWENEGLSTITMDMPETEYAVAFPKTAKSEQLKLQIDTFIRSKTESGFLADMQEKWLASSEPNGALDLSQLSGENGTLRVATTVESKPFAFLRNGQFCGMDADFIYHFAMEYGYALEIDTMDFGALLSSIAADRYDLALSGITVTEERRESVLFSDIYCSCPIVMAVLEENTAKVPTLADLEHSTLGIVTGTTLDTIAQRDFPHAQRKYFSSGADALLALKQGKVDAFFADNTVFAGMAWESHDEVTCINEPIESVSNALILAKEGYSETLLAQINAFVAKSNSDGTLDRLTSKWFGDIEPSEHPDYSALGGENGTLRIAIGDSMKPVAYKKGNLYTGFEVDFLTLFAAEYGYKLEMEGMAFDALIPAVATGRCDIGACGITITPERTEEVTFADSHFETYCIAVIRKEVTAQVGFWEDLADSFEKTFIRESRWKLILEGVGVTMLISACAAVAGTLLGFGLFMLTRSDIKQLQVPARAIAKVYSRIVAGTPVVVILMILFYVVFGRLRNMSGIVVAIIGFTLTFGAFVYDHMTVSVSSVDRGQTEAAYALGYTKNKTFFRIVLPQAMSIFLPSYCGQAVELIKATAVVGYIAVNDLTKMGDIIRSNTYEAFFPLIATAVIYFLLTWGLSMLLGLVKLRFEPKRRSTEKILKGVETA